MKEINSHKIKRSYMISSLAVVLFLSVSLTSLFMFNMVRVEDEHTEHMKREILNSKHSYIEDVINRIILDIEHERTLCFEYVEHAVIHQGDASDTPLIAHCNETYIKDLIKNRIRAIRLKNNGYIWINKVLDFAGGDDYAIRLVHPNLPETEGMLLSTNNKDIKGNLPYLEELEGVKKDGEVFFDYWFKKMGAPEIQHKVTFAKLYKPYNWIIATGVYLDDIDQLSQDSAAGLNARIKIQTQQAILLALTAAIAAWCLSLLLSRRIKKIITYYIRQVDCREQKLTELNDSLESQVESRTQEVIASETKYRVYVENAPVGIFITDPNGKYIDSNEAARKLTGYSKDELLSMTILDLVPEHLKTIALEDIEELKLNGVIQTEYRFVKQNNKVIDVSLKSILLPNNNLMSFCSDITEQLKTEEKLRFQINEFKTSQKLLKESEERFKALHDASYGGVIIHDKGLILDCNQALCDITGHTHEELIGMDGFKLIAPDSLDIVLKNIKRKLKERYEVEGIRKDGTTYPLSIRGKNVQYKGREVRVIEFCDITDIKQAEAELRKSEEKQRAIIENIVDVIAIVDQDGINRFKSPNIEKWFGWHPEEVIDVSMWERIHPDDQESVQRNFTKLLSRPDATTKGECHFLCKDGSYKWIEFAGINRLHDPNISGILLSYHDISARKKYLEEYKRSAQLAALGTVAAGVAHEINNPMQGIINYAAMIKNNPEKTDRVLDLSQRITKESDRVVQITKNMLHYSRVSKKDFTVTDISELISSAVSLMKTNIAHKGIQIDLQLPDIPVMAAVLPQEIQQVITNLISNSCDAILDKNTVPADKIIQLNGQVETVDSQPFFVLSVKDNGKGIPEHDLQKVKDPFFTTKEQTKGTGLGLAIISEIVEKHHGSLEIESEEDQYTKVIITLPLQT